MRIYEISFKYTKPLAQYESESTEAKAVVEETECATEALKKLKAFVREEKLEVETAPAVKEAVEESTKQLDLYFQATPDLEEVKKEEKKVEKKAKKEESLEDIGIATRSRPPRKKERRNPDMVPPVPVAPYHKANDVVIPPPAEDEIVEEVPATKGKKALKPKLEPYSREIELHKRLLTSYLDKKSSKWKNNIAFWKDFSIKNEGKDFLDADGKICASFTILINQAVKESGLE